MPKEGRQSERENWSLLVPVGPLDMGLLDFLSLVLPDTLGGTFRVHERALSADPAYDPVRRQWNAGRLLQDLETLPEAAGARRVLGITDLDLFIPILTFVFGLAKLGGQSAVVSLHRLHGVFYGLPEDSELLLARLEKEALHELGHTFQLKHCPEHSCVMHYSNAVEEVDLKTARFCRRCREEGGLP